MTNYRDPLFIATIVSEDDYKDYRLVSVIKRESYKYDECPEVIVERSVVDALGNPGWTKASSEVATKCIAQYLRIHATDLAAAKRLEEVEDDDRISL